MMQKAGAEINACYSTEHTLTAAAANADVCFIACRETLSRVNIRNHLLSFAIMCYLIMQRSRTAAADAIIITALSQHAVQLCSDLQLTG